MPATLTATPPPRFSRWTVRQRPVGDWVVTQIDNLTKRVTRHGPFKREDWARELAADLNGD